MKPDTTDPVVLTRGILDGLMTDRRGYSRATLTALGVPWPPPRGGWKRRLVGRRITRRTLHAARCGRYRHYSGVRTTKPNSTAQAVSKHVSRLNERKTGPTALVGSQTDLPSPQATPDGPALSLGHPSLSGCSAGQVSQVRPSVTTPLSDAPVTSVEELAAALEADAGRPGTA